MILSTLDVTLPVLCAGLFTLKCSKSFKGYALKKKKQPTCSMGVPEEMRMSSTGANGVLDFEVAFDLKSNHLKLIVSHH